MSIAKRSWRCVCSRSSRAIFVAALAVLALFAVSPRTSFAQGEKATLSGTVTDSSGGVIVDAKVQATNTSTGLVYTANTDGQGRYTLPEMQVGAYEVTAQKAGFEQIRQTGIVLSVGARPVLDFKLPVGKSTQVVEVQGEASRVDTETASVGQLVSASQMANLPINGRNFADLITLAPGVASVAPSAGGGGQSSTVYGNQTNYSVSGSRPVGTEYLLDGTDIRGWLDHGAGVSVLGTTLGMEAIQEFNIMTNTYGAEFGGTGAAINAVTKSGTNGFHGSAYEYARNSVLDSSNYFDVPGDKPGFSRNQFGGSLGGPIVKDKAFFFVNYEGLRATQGTTSRAVVPVSPDSVFQYEGYTQNPEGQWFNGASQWSPVTQAIMGLYPNAQTLTQCPNVTNQPLTPGVTGMFCSTDNQTGNEDYVLGRVDYVLGPKDSLFGRYVRESAYQLVPYSNTPLPGYPEADNERNQYFTIEERHIFSSRLVNELRFGYVRGFTETQNPGAASNGALCTDYNPLTPSGCNPLVGVAGREAMSFITPGLYISGLGPSQSSPSRPVSNRFSVGDDVVLSLGAHSIHFGASISRADLNLIWNQYSGGAWIFNNAIAETEAGVPLLCVCAADPAYAYTTPGGTNYPFSDRAYWRQTWVDPYIQDDWKITNRLTLNIGLRYDWASNPTMAGKQPIFILPDLTAQTTTENSFITAKHPFTNNPNKLNFDPRIGIAWDPFGDHKTSIRAGFGMFHEPVTARTYALDNTSMRPNEPLFFLFFDGGFPALPTSPGQLIGGVPAENQIAWYYAILPNVDTSPYVMQYNLNVQRELGHGTVLTVGYNGSQGDHLFYWIDANPPLAYGDATNAQLTAPGAFGAPSIQQTFAGTGVTGTGPRGTVSNPFIGLHENPNFQAVESVQPKAHSSYNSLQATLSRQFARSLVGNVGFTWSKCLDDASATISTEQGEWAVEDAYNPSLDRGPCSFSSNKVFTANAIYHLPFSGNRLKDGWQISPIVSYATGLPFNLQNAFGGLYQSQIGGATEAERPNRIAGCQPMVRKVAEWWNPECYTLAPFGTLGSSPRDSLVNPNYSDADFAIFKDTKINERFTLQLRAEFFDIFNHPNFVLGPQTYLMSPSNTVSPLSPNYSQLSNPAAYLPPSPTTAGGVLCNPSQVVGNTSPAGPCYTPTTSLLTTTPGDKGGQRQIQFALRLMF